MLEFEKNKLKAEIGSRNEVVIREKFDASLVWQSVSLITSWLDKYQLTLMQTGDLASFRAFESWARGEIFKIQRDMKIIMQDITTTRVFQTEVNWLRDENRNLKNEVRSFNSRLEELEKAVERKNVEVNDNQVDWGEKLKEVQRELVDLKPSNHPRKVKFQDLTIYSLKDMLDWLQEHIPSLNYALITDLYTILEHVYHQINPSKSILDFF